MRYLGGISGSGKVTCNGVEIATARYELEGYTQKAGGLTGSGELRMPSEALRSLFGRSDVKLLTGDGLLLNVRFSDKKLNADNLAYIEISGNLPAEHAWRH